MLNDDLLVNEITITISGDVRTGKTVLASILFKILKFSGFNIEWTDGNNPTNQKVAEAALNIADYTKLDKSRWSIKIKS